MITLAHAGAERERKIRRQKLKIRLTNPILVVVRARPMLRTNNPIRAFCSGVDSGTGRFNQLFMAAQVDLSNDLARHAVR
jgi:hypothetical protein